MAPQWVEVNTAAIRVENQRAFGGPWLAGQILRKLQLDDFLGRTIAQGKEDVSWSLMAQVLLICRLCNPSSELHIAEHYYRSTAMSELLGVPAEKVYDERLYRALDKLLPHKEALEKHLKNRRGELFALKYDLLLYDVTSTYFEGQAQANPKAQRGYSRGMKQNLPGRSGLLAPEASKDEGIFAQRLRRSRRQMILRRQMTGHKTFQRLTRLTIKKVKPFHGNPLELLGQNKPASSRAQMS